MSTADGRRLDWLDVFTQHRFAGNPLAVVPDADGLEAEQMQTIAGELGLSETVFVFGGNERLRIFTPKAELPLGGHPVVGASIDLARLGRIPADGVHVFATQAGDVPVAVSGAVATMQQGRFDRGTELDPEEIAPLVGLDSSEIVGTPRICSTTSFPQAFVRVPDHATLAGLRPDLPALQELPDADGVVAWCDDGDDLTQRFFAPKIGVAEDPATGSAAGALGALRVFEGAEPGTIAVRQGEEIGRPSLIHVIVAGAPFAPEDVRVGGSAVLVLEARLAERV